MKTIAQEMIFKARKYIPNLSVILITLITLVSCGNSVNNKNTDNPENEGIVVEKDPTLLTYYLEIKDALVQTDGTSAAKAAQKLAQSAENHQGELIHKIRTDAQKIADTDMPDIQRDHFNSLSENMCEWIKNENPNDQVLYRQYCPMAFDNSGAYWLSAEKEIKNPYFGDKMLRCGTIKEEL